MISETVRRFSKEELAEQAGSTFDCAIAGGVSVPALLSDLEDGPVAPGHEQFALHFTLPADTPPVQGTYAMDHPVLGPVQWFLVPIGRDSGGLYMEAVFNRRVQPAEG